MAFRRGGVEHIVVAVALDTGGSRDALIARVAMTGETLRFTVDEIKNLAVIE